MARPINNRTPTKVVRGPKRVEDEALTDEEAAKDVPLPVLPLDPTQVPPIVLPPPS